MPLILHKDFNHTVQTTKQHSWVTMCRGGRERRPGLINLPDFPTLSWISFYQCCNTACQGLSNGARGDFSGPIYFRADNFTRFLLPLAGNTWREWCFYLIQISVQRTEKPMKAPLGFFRPSQ